MAYGDESPLVGLNYVRDAATNLALANASTLSHLVLSHPVSMHGTTGLSPEKHHDVPKRMPLEMPAPPDTFPNLPDENPIIPTLSHYGDPKANSSMLRRLAEKFGLPH